MRSLFQANSVVSGKNAIPQLKDWLDKSKYSSLYILTDKNTKKHCLPVLLKALPELRSASVICIPPGEKNKTLETAATIWQALGKKADRQSVLLNLGGGVVSDIGGFTASCFKRGIRFINIPTSLMGMVDAAIGGKTGIDFSDLKNEIGSFAFPEKVIIHTPFLATLPLAELKSGYAEMLKHALIADYYYWLELKRHPVEKVPPRNWLKLINFSIGIKSEIISVDPLEKSIRSALNFGHTFGHAIESSIVAGKKKATITHGEAIAAGMIIESYIGHKVLKMNTKELEEITSSIKKIYSFIEFDQEDVLRLIRYDKKNLAGKVRFSLIQSISKPYLYMKCPTKVCIDAMKYYQSIYAR